MNLSDPKVKEVYVGLKRITEGRKLKNRILWWADDNWSKIQKILITVIGFLVLGLIAYSVWFIFLSGEYRGQGNCQYEYDGRECID